MQDSLIIDGRYCGPPGSGNGGYVCGRLAALLDGPVEITLRSPPPLERALNIAASDGGLELSDGQTLLAEARPADLAIDVPPAPTLAAATEAGRNYRGFAEHPYPHCFVCGPARQQDDGLRIFAGPLRPGLVAAVWRPSPTLGDTAGRLPREFLWAALDCPGYFAAAGERLSRMLLGRMTGEVTAAAQVGEPCLVLGWRLGGEGRKQFVGTALYDAAGQLLGRARAVWIELRQPPGEVA